MRRLFTGNFCNGLVALGERNSYAFPMAWITVDWTEADFSLWLSKDSRLPFADNSQRIIYTAHMLEHVEDGVLESLLREIYRVLGPKGAVRIETPDAEKLIMAYRQNNRTTLDYFRRGREELIQRRPHLGKKYLEDHLTVLGEVSNYVDYSEGALHIPVYADRDAFEKELGKGVEEFNRWAQSLKTPEQARSGGHANTLTPNKLELMLRAAGFSDVRLAACGKSSIPRLRLGRGWRRFYDSVPETESRAFYSLYLEAFK